MNKLHTVKNNYDFDRIIKNNKAYKYKDYIIYLEKVENLNYKFGLSVGKKIGNAVIRNKIKRQLREIISENDYQKNFDCIIIVKKEICTASYLAIKEDINETFKKLRLVKENQ